MGGNPKKILWGSTFAKFPPKKNHHKGSSKKNILMDLVQLHSTPPPFVVDYIFFTVPIIAYIMKGGENMIGGPSKG